MKVGDRVIWKQDIGYFDPLLAFEQQEVPAVIIGFTKKRIRIKTEWVNMETGEIIEKIHVVTENRLRQEEK